MTRVIIITARMTASNLKAEQEISQTSLSLSELWGFPTTSFLTTLDLSSDLMLA